jgi:hypothetical protein
VLAKRPSRWPLPSILYNCQPNIVICCAVANGRERWPFSDWVARRVRVRIGEERTYTMTGSKVDILLESGDVVVVLC